MKYFSLNLETISPLSIRADHSPTSAENAGYISGTALMGSLAAVHRHFYQETDSDQFKQLFLSELVSYPDLYPATFGSEEMQNASNAPVYPLPKTAQTCKRFSGFTPLADEKDVEKDDRHGARDTLFGWAAFKLADEAIKRGTNGSNISADPSALLAPLINHKECGYKGCKKPMDHFTGYYRRANGKLAQAEVETRLQTHTGINRDTGTVQEGILYNRRVFNERTHFWGMVKLSDDIAGQWQEFLGEVGQTGLVRIGTGRTRGLGKVGLSIELMEEAQYGFEAFKENLGKFDDKLRNAVLGVFPPNKYNLALKPFYFAITLHSPAILRDPLLRYYGTIDEKTLVELLGLPDMSADTFQQVYQTASTRRVTGWNELWGTPRMNEYAIDTGSVFLFASTIEWNNTIREALFKLEEEGIGERRAEGFGRVRISDPFHLERELI